MILIMLASIVEKLTTYNGDQTKVGSFLGYLSIVWIESRPELDPSSFNEKSFKDPFALMISFYFDAIDDENGRKIHLKQVSFILK